jgi:hypothetical protein
VTSRQAANGSCSAWATRSTATSSGSAVASASTATSVGPANPSILTRSATSRLASAVYRLPGPVTESTAATVAVPQASAATA